MPDAIEDPEQDAAIRAAEHAIAVLAGPGSGKTRTLSLRARFLLQRDPKSHARLLTFGNRAAAEMKARALAATPLASTRIRASTYHAFGVELLQAHGREVGIDPTFEVLDEEEAKELAAEVGRASGLENRSALWSSARIRRQPAVGRVGAFGEAYERAKRDLGVVDFDDLTVYAADLLERFDELAENYALRHPHLLIDEFQDTNPVQFVIVTRLAAFSETVSVFADDDQAILSFAGAEAAHIQRLIDELGARRFDLTWNYRCCEEIVRHANRLIACDPYASGREMRTPTPGGEVRVSSYSGVGAEASAVADEIVELVDSGEAEPGDVGVLVRQAARAEALVDALTARGVPTEVWLGTVYSSAMRRTLRSVLSVVQYELNDRQTRRLCQLLGIEEADSRTTEAILGRAPSGVAEQLRCLSVAAWESARPSEVVSLALGVMRTLGSQHVSATEAFLEALRQRESEDQDVTLQDVLSDLALGATAGPASSGDKVKVSTLHRTKGLQWRHVYLLGLEERTLPDHRSLTGEKLREERRVAFVGTCRARERLTLTWCREVRGHTQQPSRFLAEMRDGKT